jgi:hypothetical protein
MNPFRVLYRREGLDAPMRYRCIHDRHGSTESWCPLNIDVQSVGTEPVVDGQHRLTALRDLANPCPKSASDTVIDVYGETTPDTHSSVTRNTPTTRDSGIRITSDHRKQHRKGAIERELVDRTHTLLASLVPHTRRSWVSQVGTAVRSSVLGNFGIGKSSSLGPIVAQFFERALVVIDAQQNLTVTSRAAQLRDEVVAWSDRSQQSADQTIRQFEAYLRARSANSSSSTTLEEWDGLIVALAATFESAKPVVDQADAPAALRLMARIYQALSFGVQALAGAGSVWRGREIDGLIQEIVISKATKEGIAVKLTPLGSLRGCLIQTKYGASIHVNSTLCEQQRHWVMMHELAHWMLVHRPGSECGFDPRRVSAEFKDLLARQEDEADYVADLWSHALGGMLVYFECKSGGSTEWNALWPRERRTETVLGNPMTIPAIAQRNGSPTDFLQ